MCLGALAALAHAGERSDDARTAALAGAVVAQADASGALLANPAGIAFLEQRAFAASLEPRVAVQADFGGFDPVPGAGTRGERPGSLEPGFSFHWVEPLATRWAVAASLERASSADVEWEDGDRWAGRAISRRSRIGGFRVGAGCAVRLSPRLSVGAGPVAHAGTFEWNREERAFYAPSGVEETVGTSRLDSELAWGLGWSLGTMYRGNGRWSFGARWSSAASREFRGAARFEQIPSGDPTFDAFAATQRPWGAAVRWSARWRVPETAAVGAGWQLRSTMRLEVDVEHRRFGARPALRVRFPADPALDRVPLAGWRDRFAARAGLRWHGLGNGEWRAGLAWEPSPQPPADADPFLALGDRLTAAVGFGVRVGTVRSDIALVARRASTVTVRGGSAGFDGRYREADLGVVVGLVW